MSRDQTSEFGDAYESEVGAPPLPNTIASAIADRSLSEVPLREALMVEASTSVADAIRAMNTKRLGYALVLDGARLVGIFTERDVLTKVACSEVSSAAAVSTLMTPDPDTLPAHASIAFALQRMSVEGYRHIPLVDDAGRPTGLVAERDIVAWIVDQFPDGLLNMPPKPQLTTSVDGG